MIRKSSSSDFRSILFPLGMLALTMILLAVPWRRASSQGNYGSARAGAVSPAEKSAWTAINKSTLLSHIKALSSDAFEGRAPASRGEKITLDFLQMEFRKIGAAPGNPDGTYLQKVPMVGITADPSAQLVFTPLADSQAQPLTLSFGDEFVAWTKHEEPQVRLSAPLVFVGYGVVAPEYHWDDYKGVDVRGKVLVMLVNDPQVPDPADPAKLDSNMFRGKAMTYYGRWTYKYEIAAQKGAAGALIVHQTGPAGYPWAVVRGSNSVEHFDLLRADKNASRAKIEGWIAEENARKLFSLAGQNFDEMAKAAILPDFKPVPLPMTASIKLRSTIRQIDSSNVVAKIPGSDPRLREQYVIYTAHWDHLGMGPSVNGDRIYHGAIDNASGVAGLLELAKAFKQVQPQPRRSILFLSVTAEEKGLLGSEYYAEHPLYPLKDTLADINMDGLDVLGKTRNITVIGLGNSSLDDYVKAVAAAQGRSVIPDPEPEKGYYYRSDHFNFAKVGVPALDPDVGDDFVGKPAGWGLAMSQKFTAEDYHKPSDVVKPYWNLDGGVDDLELLFSVGYRVANAGRFPEWKAGTEFRALRDAMLKGKPTSGR